ncbi:MAG: hypothetical protein ACOCUU_00680 [Nanoarchaeota archaeon]
MIYDPVGDFGEGIGRGATKGILNYGEKKIKEFITLFKDKKIGFIGDNKTIENAKQTKVSGEWAFYKPYIKDEELRFIIRLGLVLRKIEADTERLQNLKDKIKRRYGVKGLHIAYFVQNGALNRYVAILLDDLDSTETLTKVITSTLQNIEKHAIFVNWRYKANELVKESITKISSHSPSIFMISGVGPAAKIIKESEQLLTDTLNKYRLEKISTRNKEILFFKILIS